MSANLWDASAVNFKPDADGVYICGTSTGELNCSIAGASALSANQTVHFGASLRGAGKGYLSPFVEYRNAVGNLNWVGFPHWTPTDQWQRFEATCVVPSGMTITKIGFNTSGATGDIEVMNPAWSYGSPVCLASSAHTPYATQDHVMVTYATKASLKVTDDSVKAEVSARAQTDRNVADLSSRLTQTANSLSSEISDRKSAITTVTGLANAAQSTADSASEQTVELSSRLDQSTTDITATIESKVQTVQQGVDDNASDVKNLNDRLSDEIRTRKSFMRFSEESSDPTLTLGQTDSPAQVKLTNKQLQFLYLNTVVAYMSGDALLINNAKILQQLQLGGFAFVPRENGNLSLKWVG